MNAPTDEIRIGISSCLLGEEVRWDGGHKRDRFVNDQLAAFVTFVAVCPEVEIGLGIPRETIRLVQDGDEVRLRGTRSETDHTASMRRFAARRVRELAKLDLSGYVLKKGSPSCGMERVKLYGPRGGPSKKGVGLFASALMEALPLLPVEEEGRLCDARLRESFIERVFAYRRLKDLFTGRWTMGQLVAFHTAEKLLLLAHDPEAYRALGRLVARAKKLPRGEVEREYGEAYMAAMKKPATRSRHVNVLQHMAGYFKKTLPAEQRAEIAEVIADFRAGLVPLIVPITLIRHHVRTRGESYLAGQVYLQPHPKELMLRNHV